ncbi:ABC-type multidrug transport system ATPase and permease component [Gaiella occulta]|uniref:ABC-type multidrug transport system ATPase and permease component n=1 Tax=Gaiella occulta TaxID=1002870 RepID=A0A7M2YVV5_9ACTN|nr:ABC transporter ATP-binding protein [Gaiella occulta]RDI73860.1 ABC-type multidrug transport system ATPase and permease component [Gaiella occulta]
MARSNARTFARLLRFLHPYRWSLGASTLLAIASQGAAVAVLVLTGFVVDELRGARDTHRLTLLIAAVLAAGVARALLMLGRRFISGRQALGVEWDMRDALYARLLRLSFGFYDRHQTGQLMSRATVDLQTIRFFLGYGLIFFAQHVVTILSVTAVLFFYEWRLALIAVAITPLLVGVAYRYSHVSHPLLRDVQQKLGEVATVAEESIVGVHVVKSFAQEERREERFRRAADAVFHASVRANAQRALYVPLLSFLPMLAQAGVLIAAGHFVVRGELTLGGFFAFNLLLTMLVAPLRMLGMWIGQAQRATASGERFFEVVDEPEEVGDAPGARELPPGPGRVTFAGVDFAYEPGRPVLHGIDLEIEPGTTVALIGASGSGKTTLASLVPRFYDASAGCVLVDGADVRDVTRRSLRRAIGVISQDPFLFSASVRDNIAFGVPDVAQELVEAAARAAQAHEFVEQLPDGYDTVIGERGVTLSGGQRQRLAIARALVIDPRILILDDATASVDAGTEALIRAGLAEAMRGRTTIVIAHRLSTIALADVVVALEHGRIVARGTQEELLHTSSVYREIHDYGLLQEIGVSA